MVNRIVVVIISVLLILGLLGIGIFYITSQPTAESIVTSFEVDSDELVYKIRNTEDEFRCQHEILLSSGKAVSTGTKCVYEEVNGNVFSSIVVEGRGWFPGEHGRYPLANSVQDMCIEIGISDPFPFNGIGELKCNAYCKPSMAICIEQDSGLWEQQLCTSDGSEVIHNICPGECIQGSCVGGERLFIVNAALIGDYIFSKDARVDVDLGVSGSNLVIGQIIQNSEIISEVSQFTNEGGEVQLIFPNVETTGQTNIIISSTVDGEHKEKILGVSFQELPISLTATTQTYQYGDDISINVNLKVENKNEANNLVTGKIIKNGQVIKESTGFTNSQGNVILSFADVRVDGSAQLQLTTIVNTQTKQVSKNIFFSSIPIELIIPPTTADYIFGSDITIPVTVKYKGNAYPSTTVYGEIKEGGTTVSEILGFTNEDGQAVLDFKTVEALGLNDLKIRVNIKGVDKEIISKMFFVDIPPIIISIGELQDRYTFGGDILVPLVVKLGNDPYEGAIVNVKILSQGSPVDEDVIVTNEDGEALISFENVDLIGDAQLEVSTTIRGKNKEASSNLFFEGVPIILSTSTISQIQYNLEQIIYQVNIENTFGSAITPGQIEDIKASGTLTDGTVIGSNVEYIGSGDYKVTSDVEGVGIYNGIITFNYQGTPFTSTGINIDVNEAILSIDTTSMDPSISLNENGTYIIAISSSLGGLVDPDNIDIKITFPSGFGSDELTMDDIVRISEGMYEFNYNKFEEVEKYTFDITADKQRYARGNAKASVSVVGVGGAAGPVWIGYLVRYKWIILAILIIIIVLGIWLGIRRKR